MLRRIGKYLITLSFLAMLVMVTASQASAVTLVFVHGKGSISPQ